ncbi:MAG: hypothetical protein ACYS72_03055, partial [Planctomycetota bacterium]
AGTILAETEMRTVTTRNPKTDELITHQVPVVPKEANPYENTSVLIEAFVVRVSTAALAELGVNPIGQAPEGISILKILACLDDAEKGEVVSGAKVTARHNNEARTKNNETFYIKRESVSTAMGKQGPVESKSVTFDAYSSGKSFSVVPRIQPKGDIRLEASYSDSGIIENEDQSIPPTKIGYDWGGVLTMSSGQPVIAGAAQNEDNVTFLILTATIQEK